MSTHWAKGQITGEDYEAIIHVQIGVKSQPVFVSYVSLETGSAVSSYIWKQERSNWCHRFISFFLCLKARKSLECFKWYLFHCLAELRWRSYTVSMMLFEDSWNLARWLIKLNCYDRRMKSRNRLNKPTKRWNVDTMIQGLSLCSQNGFSRHITQHTDAFCVLLSLHQVLEVEEEMRQLLEETETNKRIMEEKMRRLTRVLKDFWRQICAFFRAMPVCICVWIRDVLFLYVLIWLINLL